MKTYKLVPRKENINSTNCFQFTDTTLKGTA